MIAHKCLGIEKIKLLDTIETQRAAMLELENIAQYADFGVQGHLSRVQSICWILAYYASITTHKDIIHCDDVITIALASALHDIGKVGVPPEILVKPGGLTKNEFEEMKKHVSIGVSIIDGIIKKIPNSEYLKIAREMTAYHHEKWDGSGYLQGLSGEDIPIPARICAIADVYDALREKRTYKPAFKHEEAVDIIAKYRGTHFDPLLTDVFLKYHKKIKAAFHHKNGVTLEELLIV